MQAVQETPDRVELPLYDFAVCQAESRAGRCCDEQLCFLDLFPAGASPQLEPANKGSTGQAEAVTQS